jgi:glycolate oxidase FAD binding subunit
MGVSALATFAAEVGAEGAVRCAGGRTQWDVGGQPEDAAREVTAPSGVVEHLPEEMTVRVAAGTTMRELQSEVARGGQRVLLPEPGPAATVGGVLAVGRADVRRLGWGPVRDHLLEARFVSAEGRLVKTGGPTVKNVSGFDLGCLLVGSLGTLGAIAEVVLRTYPEPQATGWWCGPLDPWSVRARVHRPASVLWDGTTTWVLLEGRAVDVAASGNALRAAGCEGAGGPPPLPPHRWSVDPATLREGDPSRFGDAWVAEVGVGVVHGSSPSPPRPVPPELAALHRRVKARFDPTGRMNPGRDPLRVA